VSSETDYSGLTVNERLYSAGLSEKFDDAIRSRNRDAALSILLAVEVSDAAKSVDLVLANPKSYGLQ